MGKMREDIVGNKYGMLTVLKYSHSIKNHTYWVCQCECGKIVTLRRGAFVYQGKKCQNISCGCLKKQMDKQLKEHMRNYMKNAIIEAQNKLTNIKEIGE